MSYARRCISWSFRPTWTMTWSRARWNKAVPGSRPVRMRGRYCWGLPGLRDWERARVREANVLTMAFVALCEDVSLCGGVHFSEHPEDPGVFPFPSLWDTEEIQGVERRTN